VAGVILNLAFFLGKSVLLAPGIDHPSFQTFNLVWIVVSLVFLFRFKEKMILWIGISAIAGLIRFLILS
jgi:hypothetical protein